MPSLHTIQVWLQYLKKSWLSDKQELVFFFLCWLVYSSFPGLERLNQDSAPAPETKKIEKKKRVEAVHVPQVAPFLFPMSPDA
jgi:hypothetical protein